MNDRIYRFEFNAVSDRAGGDTFHNATGGLACGVGEATSSGGGINPERVLRPATNQALRPINKATGGLAMPAVRFGRALATGSTAALAGAGVGLAVAGVMFAVSQVQARIARLEAEAKEANARDDALIRAGMLDIYGANISFDRRGRMRIDRS